MDKLWGATGRDLMTNTKTTNSPPKQHIFAVTAPKVFGDGRYIVSRHLTRAAADRAARGKVGFEVIAL